MKEKTNSKKLNKLMNLAIYHPKEKVRKKNELRFYKDCAKIKKPYMRGEMVQTFFDKGYEHNKDKYIGKNTYIFQQRKPYLNGSKRLYKSITSGCTVYNLAKFNEKITNYSLKEVSEKQEME